MTILSPYVEKNPPPRVHYIHMGEEFENGQTFFVNATLNAIEKPTPFHEAFSLQLAYDSICLSK